MSGIVHIEMKEARNGSSAPVGPQLTLLLSAETISRAPGLTRVMETSMEWMKMANSERRLPMQVHGLPLMIRHSKQGFLTYRKIVEAITSMY